MKQTVSLGDFRDAFQKMGRGDNFSYEGLEALYDFLEECEGEDYELDVIALCCAYSEYGDVEAYADVYGLPYDICPHCNEALPDVGYKCPECGRRTIIREVVLEYIGNRTIFIPVAEDGFIIIDL
ncbi:MAG: hypothetical protein J7K40_09325 [candidate division Zixibacteria bacterium]|nr:hypothetical protein [candidate division Zixibacteria bacterium]